jgi:integrase
MPKQGRIKTKYPGVTFIEVEGASQTERIFYIRYRRQGKMIEEKAGRQYQDDMTPAKAAHIRAERIEGDQLSNQERREAARKAKLAEEGKWTLTRLWDEYEKQKPDSKAIKTDKYRFKMHLDPTLGKKQPQEIIKLEVDRLRVTLAKKLKPQTVRHIMGLLKRIVAFGVRQQLSQGLTFQVDSVRVDNLRTEDLTTEQLSSLLKAIEKSTDIEAANIMRMALFTGMRRGELFKLQWKDIDFDRGFIDIRNPKGGKSQKIPLNDQARQVLKNYPQTAENVFTRGDGKPFTDISRRVNPIKKAAGIPDDFRALHGLRHSYASMLASSGQVDMYTLQKLLTHKSPIMTQRYAHLRDETLRKASTLAGNIVEQAANSQNKEEIEAAKA